MERSIYIVIDIFMNLYMIKTADLGTKISRFSILIKVSSQQSFIET